MRKIQNILAIKMAFLFAVFCNAFVDTAHKVLLQNIAFKIFDGSTQVIWTSIINALIIIPFLLFFTFSGYLSDKYSKRDILVYGAVSSFILSSFVVVAYMMSSFYLAMFALFLLAVQSAIYSPAKFGIILDIYGKKQLSRGNAALQAVSIIAILFAIGLASYFFESLYVSKSLHLLNTKEELMVGIRPLTYYILIVALFEMIVSFIFLRRLQSSFNQNPDLKLDKKELFQGKLLTQNLKTLKSNNIIFLSVIGLSIFWGVSQGTIAVFPSYAKMYLNIQSTFVVNGIIAASGIGIALGSLFYTKLAKRYIELGTIPIAAFGMALTLYLSTLFKSPLILSLNFLFFGAFGGLFIVPLNSLIQFYAKRKILGTILAGNNWFHSLAMFLMLTLTTFVSFYDLDPLKTLYLILIIITTGSFYTIIRLPQSLAILFLKFTIGFSYRLKINGIKNIHSKNGVLLLGNHTSWIDWAIVLIAVPKEIQFMIFKPIYDKWYLNWLFRAIKAIPISNGVNKTSLKLASNELDNKRVIVLFPEGGISMDGNLGEFKKGFEKILQNCQSDVKVVPFYIGGLSRSMFGRAKSSKNLRCKATITFGKGISKEEANVLQIKQEVLALSRLNQ